MALMYWSSHVLWIFIALFLVSSLDALPPNRGEVRPNEVVPFAGLSDNYFFAGICFRDT